jgi:hypothetical protein
MEAVYCPVASVVPKSCGLLLAYCPPGSIEASKFLVVLVFGLLAALIWFLYYCKGKLDAIKERKRKRELYQAGLVMRSDEKPSIGKLN